MKKVCIIVPIHPKDYNYAENFLNSLELHPLQDEADIYFIFSTNFDYQIFYNRFLNYKSYKFLILENIYGFEVVKNAHIHGSGIITYKKLCAVNELYKNYEYLYVCDSEICAIQKINLYNFAKLFEKEKQFFCTTSSGVNHIIQSCFKYFPTEKIKNIVENSLYIWFNNLQCYISSSVPDFFLKINFNPNVNQFAWEDFDYVVYSYYMVEHQNFSYKILNDYVPHTSFLDIFPYEKNNKYYELVSKISEEDRKKIIWVPYNKDYISEFPNACLTFQLNCNSPM